MKLLVSEFKVNKLSSLGNVATVYKRTMQNA